jgi:hypothetical protein
MADPTPQQKIIDTCEANFDAHTSDCSGFLKAVAGSLEIAITGTANDIVDEIQTAPWTVLPDGVAAKAQADQGLFVVGGLKDTPHGHVVVVVQGPLAHGKYPTGYWGRLGATGMKNTTINWAWNAADSDRVTYAYVALPAQSG